MKFLCVFVVFLFLCNSVNAEEKKQLEFPPEYFKEGKESNQDLKHTPPQSKVGNKGDKFITKQQYDVAYSEVEKGNKSKIVKCPCVSGGNCGRNCHVTVIVNNKTGEKQYKYIPVQSENDSQTNPYFMMLARQRVIANTEKSETKVFKMSETKKEETKISKPEEKRLEEKKPEEKRLEDSWRFYSSIAIGTSLGGNGKFKSTERTGGYDSSKGVFPTSGEIENFSLDRSYGKAPYISAAIGVDRRFVYHGFRFDISSTARSLGGGETDSVTQSREANGGVKANFDTGNSYGNGKIYSLEANFSIDLLRRILVIYPSIGAGVGVGYLSFKNPAISGSTGITSIFAHLNFDTQGGNTFFIGPKASFFSGGTFDNNKTDRDLNAKNTKLEDSRLVYERNVEASDFSVYGIELGMRFY